MAALHVKPLAHNLLPSHRLNQVLLQPERLLLLRHRLQPILVHHLHTSHAPSQSASQVTLQHSGPTLLP